MILPRTSDGCPFAACDAVRTSPPPRPGAAILRALVAAAVLTIGLVALASLAPAHATGIALQETPSLKNSVTAGTLPPVEKRVPKDALVVNLEDRGRTLGRQGGQLRTLVSRKRDLRYVTVYSYTRLVGYDEKLQLKPDILLEVENEGDRVFTFVLREGHRWSDGHPFTTEDFRYYWEDIANNRELSPAGPPDIFFVDGEKAKVEILDERRIRFSWSRPNPRFLPHLAQPRPVFIYAPAHYLKQFHAKYTDPKKLEELAKKKKMKSWAAMHNRLDDPYENANPDMPVLNPWLPPPGNAKDRFVFERNPYYHRIDREGRQLPYVDRLVVDISAGSLVAAKANAGEVDFQARGLTMADAPVLREGEKANGYRTLLWPVARGSAYALYPNLNTEDPAWRALNRDARFRRALSLAIDRRILNNALLFGLGRESNNTVVPESPLHDPALRTLHARHDPDEANRLLDEVGLARRDSSGIRLLPDGRIAEIIVEVDGEAGDMIDALQLIAEFWRDVGVKLFVKPQERSILRNRSYSGRTVMVAAEGLDNAIPTAKMPPSELAPVRQDHYSWPKWGQFAETRGKSGEAPDTEDAKRLMALYKEWLSAGDDATKARAWREMLALHADRQWVIGTVNGQLQPVVITAQLRNVPEKALFSWEPTALIGVYRVDEFYLSE